jgi:threonylcarbamoyladenosine tRNA methylthiotransferase MtaB
MRVFLDTVGCRLNQSEIEAMAGQFRAAGHEIVSGAEAADVAVVNTCAVTAQAASDSRAAIRRIARAGARDIVATGCWVSLQPAAARALPSVKRAVVNTEKDRLVATVLGLPELDFELEPLARRPLPGLRKRTRAIIKVQDGCDNHCTFCITTVARGKGRSRAPAAVLADIRSALQGGAQEIVLTGVHLGSWGQELGSHLRWLVRAILDETDAPRLRMSSLEPWDLDEEFFSLWEDSRLCRHLHLPLQSGCAATLKRMARKATPESFRKLMVAARRVMPEVAIATDVIAGFPGETEAEFRESLAFVREMRFAGGHAFTYSARPGTAAVRLGNHVPARVRHERNAVYRSLFDEQARAYRTGFVGQTAYVLWEATTLIDGSGWRLEGWTGNYIRVTAWAPEPRWNVIDPVDLTCSSDNGLNGVIRNSG